jgi:hypothetical protein
MASHWAILHSNKRMWRSAHSISLDFETDACAHFEAIHTRAYLLHFNNIWMVRYILRITTLLTMRSDPSNQYFTSKEKTSGLERGGRREKKDISTG